MCSNESKLPSILTHSVAVTAKSSTLLNFNKKCQWRENSKSCICALNYAKPLFLDVILLLSLKSFFQIY